MFGGLAVSAFAALGDVFRPKSFAGLFGAAPSIAIATLAVMLSSKGVDYVATEARSMVLGAAALGLYSVISCQLMKRFHLSGLSSALTQGHWYEYLIRFGLGGVTTVLAGLIAVRWGPVIGGLFLAFPAIFPASATLVEKHEREKKKRRI